MPVYVDDLFSTRWRRRWPYYQACHMIADSVVELFKMANDIGLKRSWFQCRPGSIDHFDLTPGMRRKAVRAGVVALDRVDFVAKLVELREAQGCKNHVQPTDPRLIVRQALLKGLRE